MCCYVKLILSVCFIYLWVVGMLVRFFFVMNGHKVFSVYVCMQCVCMYIYILEGCEKEQKELSGDWFPPPLQRERQRECALLFFLVSDDRGIRFCLVTLCFIRFFFKFEILVRAWIPNVTWFSFFFEFYVNVFSF